ncbi:MAG: hypothetical protein FJ395_11760 [Verrucomicrobia bacterium]|nr:hypothetical protein [Verrucomicrobiota bacterium]
MGLLDADRKPIPGFNATVRTNSTSAALPWNHSALKGREVRLVFTGAQAKLYSFRFENEIP